jgi:hypothetical protein
VQRKFLNINGFLIWKRDGGLFFETASVEEAIKYLEDEIEENESCWLQWSILRENKICMQNIKYLKLISCFFNLHF